MIKILIVDDNHTKVQRIIETINRISGVSEENIDVAIDIISAKKALIMNQFDLVLLDVQLPKRFGEMPKLDGGIEFLQMLKGGKKYHKPLYIVGLTAYEEALASAVPAFAESLWAVIKYDSSSDRWETQITEKVREILDIKSEHYTLTTELSDQYIYDLAIVCALHKTELESILALPAEWKQKEFDNDSTLYYVGTFQTQTKTIKVVAAAATQMGMTAASVLTMKIIKNFCPEYLIMTGIAAGVKEHVGLGDILVADPSWDYGAGKFSWIDGRSAFIPDARQLRIAPEIHEKLLSISFNRKILDNIHNNYPHRDSPDKPLSLYVGPVASGSAVVADDSIVKGILEHERKLIGLEMETYGVYYASAYCSKPRPITFSIKSVCDFADKEKNDSCHRYAAWTSSHLMYEFVTGYLSYCDKSLRSCREVGLVASNSQM